MSSTQFHAFLLLCNDLKELKGTKYKNEENIIYYSVIMPCYNDRI